MPANRVGKVLALLRRSEDLTREQLASAMHATTRRIVSIESGRAELGYLEGQRLARATGFCPNCFRRKLERAGARDGLTAGADDEAD